MVNLANERLQRFFLASGFQREQAEYAVEALPWVPIVDVTTRRLEPLTSQQGLPADLLFELSCLDSGLRRVARRGA